MSKFEQTQLSAGRDTDTSDPDDAYGTSVNSSTVSLTSTVMDYVYENGRRYHRYAEGTYILPNDETEQDRLDLHHHIFLLLLKGRLYLAPIEKPQRILDIATGTGIWALDIAEEFPQAQVLGTDLSPIQPTWVVPNCRFEIDDAERTWTWPADHFDYIHCRNIGQSLKDWPRLIKQMYEHSKPGGWVELAESNNDLTSDDNSIPDESNLAKMIKLNKEGFEKIGLKTPSGHELRQWLEEAGFVDIEIHTIKQPWGPWPSNPELKKAGRFMLLMCQTALEAYCMALFTRVLGMDSDEVTKLCTDTWQDLSNKKIHTYNFVYHAIARKPESAAEK